MEPQMHALVSENSSVGRPEIAAARRVVLKMGTRVFTKDDGRLALARLSAIVEAAAALRDQGAEVLLVSSGAVGLGLDGLGIDETPNNVALRQACAAVGQTRLMALYQDGFAQYGLTCGQILLTESDFGNRRRYLNLRRTLTTLLECGVVPIINENDTVSAGELAPSGTTLSRRPVFRDNDRLSALIATKLHADLLVLLTDVEGCYDKDPNRYPDAKLLSRIDDPKALRGVRGSTSAAGRGGMRSKVEAAMVAARGGCNAVVASGRDPSILPRLLAGEEVGTFFPAKGDLNARHRWIAFAAAPLGALHLDSGAIDALRQRHASLLAAGVHRVDGEFSAGDVVELCGPDGAVIGRGRIPWDSPTVRAWCSGVRPPGIRNAQCLIRRNHFVLEQEIES